MPSSVARDSESYLSFGTNACLSLYFVCSPINTHPQAVLVTDEGFMCIVVSIFVNEYVIFSFLTISVFVLDNENHTDKLSVVWKCGTSKNTSCCEQIARPRVQSILILWFLLMVRLKKIQDVRHIDCCKDKWLSSEISQVYLVLVSSHLAESQIAVSWSDRQTDGQSSDIVASTISWSNHMASLRLRMRDRNRQWFTACKRVDSLRTV